MPLPITGLTAALAAIMLIVLSMIVSAGRGAAKVDLGDGGNPALLRRMRAHGNFTETVPIALILLALGELEGAATTWLWAIAGLLLVGRLAHAIGLLGNSVIPRAGGMLLTFAALLIGAGIQLVRYFA